MTTVLVVDDSPVDRRLVGGLLESESKWTVEYAAEGAEALERAKHSVPDVVVTDLRMPNMDGLELVKAMRVHHPTFGEGIVTATEIDLDDEVVTVAFEGGELKHLAASLAGLTILGE